MPCSSFLCKQEMSSAKEVALDSRLPIVNLFHLSKLFFRKCNLLEKFWELDLDQAELTMFKKESYGNQKSSNQKIRFPLNLFSSTFKSSGE